MEGGSDAAARGAGAAAGIDGLDRRLGHVFEAQMRRKLVLETLHALPAGEARLLIRQVAIQSVERRRSNVICASAAVTKDTAASTVNITPTVNRP